MTTISPIEINKQLAENTTRLNSSVIALASATPPGIPSGGNTPPQNAIDLANRLILEAIRDRADTNANVLRSAVDNVRMQISLSATQNSATVANATNTVGDLIRQTIRNNENIIKQYVDTDSTNIRRLIEVARDNVIKASKDSNDNARLFAERITKGNADNIAKQTEFAERITNAIRESGDKNADRLKPVLEELFGNAAQGIMDGFDAFLGYIVDRVTNINNTFDKLSDEEYESLKAFTDDLFGSSDSATIAGYIWQLVMFIPMLKDILTFANAPVYARLNELAMKDSSPTLLDFNTLFRGLKREYFDLNEYKEELAKQGYSDKRALDMLILSNTLPTLSDTMEFYRRGLIPKETFNQKLFELGYTEDDLLNLEKVAWFQPSVNDVIRFVVRDVYNKEISEQNKIFDGWDNPAFLEDAEKAGIKPDDARKYWGAHWQLPSPTMGYEMLFRGLIDRDKLKSLLKSADYAPAWLDFMVDIAYRVPTRVDTRNMFYDNVIDENELFRRLKAYGYNDFDAGKVKDYYVRQKVKRNTNSSKAKTLSVNIITDAFTKGIIDRNEAKTRLQTIGFSLSDAELILTEANTKLEQETSEDYTKEIRARFKAIAERNYIARTLSKQDATDLLQKAGLSSSEAKAILTLCDLEYDADRKAEIINAQRQAYLNYEIEENELKTTMIKQGFSLDEYERHIKEIRPLRNFRHKDLPFADVKKAFNLKVINIEEVRQQLLSMSYSDRDIEILEKIYFVESVEE